MRDSRLPLDGRGLRQRGPYYCGGAHQPFFWKYAGAGKRLQHQPAELVLFAERMYPGEIEAAARKAISVIL